MNERQSLLDAFIDVSPWRAWTVRRLPVDASARSYLRLKQGSESVIIMDAPPNAADNTSAFVKISNYLKQIGLCPPEILLADSENGFLALEDLGAKDIASALKHAPSKEHELYEAATDILVHLRQHAPPKLDAMTPRVGGEMVRIVGEFYAKSNALSDDLNSSISDALSKNCGPPDVMALRDYHAENLIWRPIQNGLARIGLLDFQDAFLAPDGYDLASLLRDARRDVSTACQSSTISYYATKTSMNSDELNAAIATLAVQRNLRILGVFGRLIQIQGKRKYIPMLSRVWAHIFADITHPSLSALKGIITKGIPSPDHPDIRAWTT